MKNVKAYYLSIVLFLICTLPTIAQTVHVFTPSSNKVTGISKLVSYYRFCLKLSIKGEKQYDEAIDQIQKSDANQLTKDQAIKSEQQKLAALYYDVVDAKWKFGLDDGSQLGQLGQQNRDLWLKTSQLVKGSELPTYNQIRSLTIVELRAKIQAEKDFIGESDNK